MGGRNLTHRQGDILTMGGLLQFLCISPLPRFWESKWQGKQYFNILALATSKDAKGCQEASFQLGDKTGRAAVCGLCNVAQGLWGGLRDPRVWDVNE